MSGAAGTEVRAPGALDGTLARGILIVAAFAAATAIARVGQDAAIAWRYGTSPVVDAYYFVASLASWPVAVALSVLTLLVVPLEAKLQREGRPAAGLPGFRSELLTAVLLLAAASVPVTWWALEAIAGGPLGGLDRNTAALAAAGISPMVMFVPIGLVGTLFAAWLVAAGRHELTLFESIPPLVLTAAVLLLPGSVLFWGAAAGMACQTLAMAAALVAARALPQPSWPLASPAWRGVASGAFVLVVAQVIFAFLPIIDIIFAARLGEGTVATLNFANRIVLGIQGLAGLALQRVGLPLLSRVAAVSPGHGRQLALRWAGLMGGSGLLIGAVVAALAGPLVSLLFERGRFTAVDSEQVAALLRWGMLQLSPFLAGLAVVTALASAGARNFLVVAACLGLAVKVAASALLAPAHGAAGLQVASALMYVATAMVAWLALRRRFPRTGE